MDDMGPLTAGEASSADQPDADNPVEIDRGYSSRLRYPDNILQETVELHRIPYRRPSLSIFANPYPLFFRKRQQKLGISTESFHLNSSRLMRLIIIIDFGESR